MATDIINSRYLSKKTNTHLLFERNLFGQMDEAVQKLITSITISVQKNSAFELLNVIETHCNEYNMWKQTTYDEHLAKIQQFETESNEIIYNALKHNIPPRSMPQDDPLDLGNITLNTPDIPPIPHVSMQHPQGMDHGTDLDPLDGSDHLCASLVSDHTSPPTPVGKIEAQHPIPMATPQPTMRDSLSLMSDSMDTQPKCYECLMCNREFNEEVEWKLHRIKHIIRQRIKKRKR
eukprot:236769_1